VNLQDKKQKEDYDKKVESIKANLKAIMETDMQSADFNDEMYGSEERRRGVRPSKKGHKDYMPQRRGQY